MFPTRKGRGWNIPISKHEIAVGYVIQGLAGFFQARSLCVLNEEEDRRGRREMWVRLRRGEGRGIHGARRRSHDLQRSLRGEVERGNKLNLR